MTAVQLPDSVKAVVALIVTSAKPKKLILFGSRARGTHRENSDVDLAVVGKQCTDRQWNELLIKLSDEPLSLFPIDLVEFEKVNSSYQEAILGEGKALYG